MKLGRRKGRILAFQALYAWDAAGISPGELLHFYWLEQSNEQPVPDEFFIFPRLLFLGTIEHIEAIDTMIKKHLDNWDFDRITRVDRALLRLSVYSLLYQPDIDAKIVINEAVSIARLYGTDDSFKFVNAVLDSVKKECETSHG